MTIQFICHSKGDRIILAMKSWFRRAQGALRLVVAAMFLLLAACGSMQVGKDFDLQQFRQQVKQGITTKSDIRNWLGSPASSGVTVETDGKHYEKWSYFFGSGQMPRMSDARLKYLEVRFGDDGRVVAYNWSE